MALVRRSTVMGQAPSVYIGQTAAPGTVPAQPGAHRTAASPDATVPLHLPGPGTGPDAASTPSRPASPLAVLLGFLLLAAGGGAAYSMIRWGNQAQPFKIGNQTTAYAGVAAFAAAIERFLEPFSQWLPGRKYKAQYEAVVAALANRDPMASLEAVSAAQAKLDRSTANRAVVIWGLASAVATVISAAGGFYLLHMVAADSWNPDSIPLWVDALATGLIVGTGTKPLHDLISKWQNNRGGTPLG